MLWHSCQLFFSSSETTWPKWPPSKCVVRLGLLVGWFLTVSPHRPPPPIALTHFHYLWDASEQRASSSVLLIPSFTPTALQPCLACTDLQVRSMAKFNPLISNPDSLQLFISEREEWVIFRGGGDHAIIYTVMCTKNGGKFRVNQTRVAWVKSQERYYRSSSRVWQWTGLR